MALVSNEIILLLLIFILTSSTVSKASPHNRVPNANPGTSLETESMKIEQICSPGLINQTRIYCPGKQSNNHTIELIGFLTSFDVDQNAVGTFIAGAVPLAVENVNRSVYEFLFTKDHLSLSLNIILTVIDPVKDQVIDNLITITLVSSLVL